MNIKIILIIFLILIISLIIYILTKNDKNNINDCICDSTIISRQTPANIITKNIDRTKIYNSPLTINYNDVTFYYKDKNGNAGNYIPISDNNYVMCNGVRYNLIEFHYHIKSEHKIDGEQFDAEVHFVHLNPNYNKTIKKTNYQGIEVKSKDSNEYLVIGLLFSNSKSNTNQFNGVFDESFKDSSNEIKLNLKDLNNLSYFSFPGSLTSKPFTSSITWFLSDKIIKTNIVFPLEANKLFSRSHTARPIKRDIRDTALYFV